VLETFMLNLSRGTGIRGLSGIKAKAGKIVRPLLFASRNEIEAYAKENEFDFRHDSSNDDTNIKRNKVRHEILPLLEELNPAFKKNLQHTIHTLKETEAVFLDTIESVKKSIVKKEEGWVKISKDEIQNLNPISTYLFELLREYRFKSDVVNEIIKSINTTSGTQFFSETHRLVVDRTDLIITSIKRVKPELFYIEKGVTFVEAPLRMKITFERYAPDFVIPNSIRVAVFDYDKIRFPLVLRKWHKGEYFKPLGMDGFKKLSDFFVDEKYSIPEKENAWILASDNKVVWIVGKRIDDRFKLSDQTKLVLRIEIIQF
jgi:tRNA(Ile)-lysidine synthase